MNSENSIQELEQIVDFDKETNLIINDRIIHKLYIEDIEYEINNLKADLVTYKQALNNLKKIIVKNTTLINNRTSTSVEKILNATSIALVKSIDYYNLKEETIKALKLYISNYIKTNRVVRYQEEKIKKLENKITPYNIYSKVIKQFNRKIIEECINKQYQFNMGYHLDVFRIVYAESRKLTPNWGASTKKKKEILARGGKLYNGKEAKEYEERGEPYDGEKYLVFKDPFSIWFEWCLRPVSLKYLPILRDYKFKPARGNYGSMTILGNLKKKYTDKEEIMRLFPLAKSPLTNE